MLSYVKQYEIREINLHGLVENMAFGTCFWSSSVRYFGKAHLGRAVDGPENDYILNQMMQLF